VVASVLAEEHEFDTATKKHQQGEHIMFKVSHLFYVAVAAVFAAAPVASMAAEQAPAKSGAIVLTDSAYAKATIVNIKKKERELTLRDEKGAEFVVIAGDEVRNFAQIKKGDIVEVNYQVAVATGLEKASDATVAGQTSAVERAPAGSKPGMAAMQTRTIVATVLEIDAKNRLLTAQGPRGGIVTVKVPAEMKTFDSLKKGDKISAVYSEAVAISVKSPAKKK
jgi:nitrous oxidase accessory protein NosD